MATVFTDDTHYKNIANAIRAKNGSTDTYKPSEMSAAIEAIETTPVLQQKTITPTSSTQNITPDTGYDGLSLVTVVGDSDLVAANIKKDIEIFGVTGTYEGEAPNLQEKTVIPSISAQEITFDHGYDGLSKVTVNGDADLVSENIKSGVSIFGVTGSLDSTATDPIYMGLTMYQLEPGGWTTDGVIDGNGTISFELADGFFSVINIEVYDENDVAFCYNFLIVANGNFEENQIPLIIQVYDGSGGKATFTSADMISQRF